MNRTKVDWWAWRSKGDLDSQHLALKGVFSGVRAPVTLRPRKGGFLGFKGSAQIMVGDMDVGVHAWGGENQRGWSQTTLTGQGCTWINDWDVAQEAASECADYELKRVDIALDTFDGSSTFDKTLAAYRAGGFSPAGSGRPPKCEPMKPERFEDSAIIRIGSRESDKFLRGYEKGKQVLGPAAVAAMERTPEAFAWSDFLCEREAVRIGDKLVDVPLWDWWRLELELKPKTVPLPEDVIDRRDQYFAGAYPYLGQVLQDVDAEPLIIRRERGPQRELELALSQIRAQYGNTLFTALVAHQGDFGAVWAKVVGSKHNQKLLEAGVLLVDHDAEDA